MTARSARQFFLRAFVITLVIGASLVFPQRLAWSAPETRMSDWIELPTGVSVPLEWPATHAVVQWDGEMSAVVQIRSRSAGTTGAWSEWKTALVDEDGGETQEAGMLLLDDAIAIEGRVLSGRVERVRVTAIDAENGPRHLEVATPEPAHAVNGATAQPNIVTRGQWGADESLRRGTPEFASIERMDVHHTVTDNDDPNPEATVRAIYQWHTQGNGWNDVGYNFLIDRQGRIYEGRYARSYAAGEKPTGEDIAGRGVIGAHTSNHNTGTVGIAMLGTFTTVAPSQAQQEALVNLIAWEADRHNIDPLAPGKVVGHRDLNQTTCPGDAAWRLLPQWRDLAAARKLLSYPPGNTPGYWVSGTNGSVTAYGAAANYGSMAGQYLSAPIASMSRTFNGRGYWLMGTDGGIFSFGDATFFGSMGGKPLNQPIVGLAPTPSGNGYWLVARDGGIFSFGDATFFGSMGGKPLNQPIVGMAATSTGQGYWLVASDGGIFAFGDAKFYGSTGSIRLSQPVVTMAAAPNGQGYWLFAKDGGVFAFNVPFLGSIPMLRLNSFGGVAEAAATESGTGYYLIGGDGGVYTFGDARFFGAPSGVTTAGFALAPRS